MLVIAALHFAWKARAQNVRASSPQESNWFILAKSKWQQPPPIKSSAVSLVGATKTTILLNPWRAPQIDGAEKGSQVPYELWTAWRVRISWSTALKWYEQRGIKHTRQMCLPPFPLHSTSTLSCCHDYFNMAHNCFPPNSAKALNRRQRSTAWRKKFTNIIITKYIMFGDADWFKKRCFFHLGTDPPTSWGYKRFISLDLSRKKTKPKQNKILKNPETLIKV